MMSLRIVGLRAFMPRKILVIGGIRRLEKVVQGPKNTPVC
jgi:hypothetical protein